ncbi:MAG: hypothetical protein NTX28_17240, partial [Novosphingobium sp.]|nr:hypothetical protein [Novosphingobium sp.]
SRQRWRFQPVQARAARQAAMRADHPSETVGVQDLPALNFQPRRGKEFQAPDVPCRTVVPSAHGNFGFGASPSLVTDSPVAFGPSTT